MAREFEIYRGTYHNLTEYRLADQPSIGQETKDYSALRQLLTHVPDVVINCDHKKSMPRVKRVVGVCMFADISGKVESVNRNLTKPIGT